MESVLQALIKRYVKHSVYSKCSVVTKQSYKISVHLCPSVVVQVRTTVHCLSCGSWLKILFGWVYVAPASACSMFHAFDASALWLSSPTTHPKSMSSRNLRIKQQFSPSPSPSPRYPGQYSIFLSALHFQRAGYCFIRVFPATNIHFQSKDFMSRRRIFAPLALFLATVPVLVRHRTRLPRPSNPKDN